MGIDPADQRQAHYVKVARGRAEALTLVETACLKFIEDHPEVVDQF